jgi:hypothetical protein
MEWEEISADLWVLKNNNKFVTALIYRWWGTWGVFFGLGSLRPFKSFTDLDQAKKYAEKMVGSPYEL